MDRPTAGTPVVESPEPPVAEAVLDAERCYRALESRDGRFDGLFFIGVVTTGIYCRPVCPARTPRRCNVRFYACAAAAEAAGFRACRRCRPETAPGTPAWLGTSATVARALRHIDAGALDETGVEELAGRLGIGERHLRRLFLVHLGASPIAVAQTRRLHFARKLIDETRLPMTRVAFEAGFSSVRRFNTAVKRAYGCSPRELRGGSPRADAREGQLCLRLGYRPPFDARRLFGFLALRAIPGVEVVTASGYRRSVRLAVEGRAGWEERCGTISVTAPRTGNFLELRVAPELSAGLARIAHGVRRLFDLGADPREITAWLRRDPGLRGRLVRAPGLRVPGAFDGFELAVRAILGQQVSVRGATTLAGRVVKQFGTPLGDTAAGEPTHAFPSARALCDTELESVGLTRARAGAIRGLAQAVAAGGLELDRPLGLDPALATLEALPGIGPWTAHYVAMRALGEPDAFPASDLGLRKALGAHGSPLPERVLAERAEAWRPWRAYAAMALWCA